MSHQATNWAFAQRGLKPATKIVLLQLADRHNPDFGCFPSQGTLAKDCEMSERAIRNHLEILEDLGLIEREKRIKDGRYTSTRYLLQFEMVNSCQRQNVPSDHRQNVPLDQRQNVPPNPVSINPVIKPCNLMVEGPSFDDFWAVVPKKVAKPKAKKAWDKAIKQATPELIIAGMERYAKEKHGTDKQFTAHPATWLNDERWADDASPQHAQRGNTFLDKVRQQMKGTENETGLFNKNADDTKRIN